MSGGREERRECQWGRSGDEGGRRDEGTRGEASEMSRGGDGEGGECRRDGDRQWTSIE